MHLFVHISFSAEVKSLWESAACSSFLLIQMFDLPWWWWSSGADGAALRWAGADPEASDQAKENGICHQVSAPVSCWGVNVAFKTKPLSGSVCWCLCECFRCHLTDLLWKCWWVESAWRHVSGFEVSKTWAVSRKPWPKHTVVWCWTLQLNRCPWLSFEATNSVLFWVRWSVLCVGVSLLNNYCYDFTCFVYGTAMTAVSLSGTVQILQLCIQASHLASWLPIPT